LVFFSDFYYLLEIHVCDIAFHFPAAFFCFQQITLLRLLWHRSCEFSAFGLFPLELAEFFEEKMTVVPAPGL